MKRFTPLALAVASAYPVAAEQLPMEHILVSVPVHKKVAETALPVTVLSGDELRRQARNTIGDSLANSPGLANASFGPGVGQPVIRGQAGPRVTVLQNGTSSADASNISADHAIAVEPLLAESVEVLRGPATLLYGGGAIGGVVNVLDNRIPTAALSSVSAAGEYRHDTASSGNTLVGKLEGGNGQFAWHLDGLLRDWDDIEIPGTSLRAHEDDHDGEHEEEHGEEEGSVGFVENTDGETWNLNLGGAWHWDRGFVGLAVSRLENEYGIPPGGHGHHEEEHEEKHQEEHGGEEENIRIDMEQTRYDANLHIHEPFAGLDVFRGFLTYTDYEHVELEGEEVGTQYSNKSWETRLELVHNPWGRAHGSFGLQAGGGEFSAVGEESFIPVTDSSEIGLFLVEDFHFERWTLEGGLRVDWVERDPDTPAADKTDFTSYSVSGTALFELSTEWQLGLALMRAERAPAIEELYSNVGSDDPAAWVVHAATRSIEVGDPDLDTETSNNLDLSISWLPDDQLVTINAFYNDFSDYINLLNTGLEVDETPVLVYSNDDAEFYGVEVDSDFKLAELGGGQLNLAIQGDYIRGELDAGGDVPRLPPLRLGAKLSWSNENWLLFGGVLEADDQDKPGANEEPTEGYTRWDAGLEYRWPMGSETELLLFVNFKNITDEEIRLSTSFLRDFAPEPGRSVEGGIRLLL